MAFVAGGIGRIMKKQGNSFLFGPDVIRHLLPHRRPFLMVDTVTSYERSATPVLCTSRYISSNEDVFEGHFPGLHLWPGVYTIEGLGQSTNILQIIWTVQNVCEERGINPELFMDELLNLQRGYEMRPGYRRESSASLLEILKLTPRRFTKKVFLKLLQQSMLTKEWMTNAIYESRAKDYQNPFRQMVYSTEQEMEKVIGKLKDNTFIVQQSEDTAAFSKKAAGIIQQMS